MSTRPLVGIICCTRFPEDPVQGVAERYLRAAPNIGADVVLIPSMSGLNDIGSLVERLDGILLTGSPSNIEAARYNSTDAGEGPFDPPRDETAMSLIGAAVERDRPLLGICRGFQEIAVSYGATLRRNLGDSDREQIHHTPPGVAMSEMFALQHRISLTPGGILERTMRAPSIIVNSAHFQGVADLGPKLAVEATSWDGVVEAIRPVSGSRVLGVQWHPEWHAGENAHSKALFAWFGMLIRGASFEEAADRAAGSLSEGAGQKAAGK
jgi:putative glutamine amidotransferase